MGKMNMGKPGNGGCRNREIESTISPPIFSRTAGNARIAGVRAPRPGERRLQRRVCWTVDCWRQRCSVDWARERKVDLTFPGTDYKQASGAITTQLTAEAGEVSADRIPITGQVAVRADKGTFNIQQVNLQTPATQLKASGQFSFENDSNLTVDLASSDAEELQTVLISSGLLPEVEEQMRSYGIGLAGELAFNGNIGNPIARSNGTFSLGSVLVNGTEVGSLSAAIAMNAQGDQGLERTFD